MGKVFISYSVKNQKLANELCAYLEQTGVPCWIAPRDIPSASNYAGEITRAIKAADDVLLVYSKDSSKSVHVKNEINLAINNAKSILPYCIDNSPYDDDLEYYLSSRQKIVSYGDIPKDFALIRHALAPHHPETVAPPAAAATGKPETTPKRNRFLIPLVCAVLLLAGPGLFLMLRNRPTPPVSPDVAETVDSLLVPRDSTLIPDGKTKPDPDEQTKDSGQKQNKDQQHKDQKQQTPTPAVDTNADTFTGTIKNGYPDGYGVYTFKQRRRIDMHDEKQRFAEKGDYIEGTWTNGHLNFGEWYGANGVKKEFIELGDYPDVQADHVFKKCVKP